jgi:hypothetical protein
MRYRGLNLALSHEIADDLVQGVDVPVEARAGDHGEGESLDEYQLREIMVRFRQELTETPPADAEIFEGRLAAATYPWFSGVPVEVLDDPSFWRYVALRHFWWFIAWREAEPISKGNYHNLVDARFPAEQIPLRLFLRAKAVAAGDDVALAGEIPKSTDFWRSHITRVRVGTAPTVARAFAEAKRDEKNLAQPLGTSKLREVAKRVNRMWSNVRLDTYDRDEARRFIDEMIEVDDK